MPLALLDKADALYWKGLVGFDFSAYALLLDEIVLKSPGADVYLQNDSVLGPFGDLEVLIASMPWRVSGFMASSGAQNHLQSYALFFRRVDPALMSGLSAIFSKRWAYDRYRDVVNLQETRMASVAARHASVGAAWYAPCVHEDAPSLSAIIRHKFGIADASPRRTRDPSLCDVEDLLAQGFPFLKRSLFTRNVDLNPRAPLDAFLAQQGHPPMDAT
ncbi:hypothetical protein [Sphingomonas sp. M1-B02]|uniref:hypothetical protein n=1 Tax=Sphingomonas sp. M1-B02 TaxID=3114300 RepID=UPI002240E1DD|nr:hypothetical protein [Sphingomonas sp. S6-11]UZK65050.1 hypothetical protein OKW87_11045 [Sphingomonas sp. S6-11]